MVLVPFAALQFSCELCPPFSKWLPCDAVVALTYLNLGLSVNGLDLASGRSLPIPSRHMTLQLLLKTSESRPTLKNTSYSRRVHSVSPLGLLSSANDEDKLYWSFTVLLSLLWKFYAIMLGCVV